MEKHASGKQPSLVLTAVLLIGIWAPASILLSSVFEMEWLWLEVCVVCLTILNFLRKSFHSKTSFLVAEKHR